MAGRPIPVPRAGVARHPQHPNTQQAIDVQRRHAGGRHGDEDINAIGALMQGLHCRQSTDAGSSWAQLDAEVDQGDPLAVANPPT